MYFCDSCQRCLKRETSSGIVMYRCDACSKTIVGDPSSTRLAGETFGTRREWGRNDRLLDLSPLDRAACHVKRICKCGLDYMTMVRIGAAEAITFTCKCSYREHPK